MLLHDFSFLLRCSYLLLPLLDPLLSIFDLHNLDKLIHSAPMLPNEIFLSIFLVPLVSDHICCTHDLISEFHVASLLGLLDHDLQIVIVLLALLEVCDHRFLRRYLGLIYAGIALVVLVHIHLGDIG